MIFFTSDHHFGHANIIRLCKRPFTDLHSMNEAMTARWNAVVAPKDAVYHLGDFALGDHRPYLQRLNGSKILIPGNHDKHYLKAGWDDILCGLHEEKVEGVDLVLCHYALRVWRGSHRGALHLYGHSHGNLPGDDHCTDVGVDVWNFTPVTLTEIKDRLRVSPPRQHKDHHKP